MAQSTSLIKALKKSLKINGKSYSDVAVALSLSEASIKRMFSEKNISLQRLDQICKMLEMDFSDLVQMMNEDKRHISELSIEAEQEIAGDLALLLITVCVLNRCSMHDIMSRYQFSETECIQKLAKLDRLKIIELLPGNRIKLLVSANFSWLKNGPIQAFFQQKIEADFFNSTFEWDNEKLVVLNGMFSKSSNASFQRKMARLANEFDELNNDDAGLPIAERYGHTVVIALRPWRYGLFSHLAKNAD